MQSLRIDDVELEIGKTLTIGGEDQVFLRRVVIGGPSHAKIMGELLNIATIQIHRHDIGIDPFFIKAPPYDSLPIRRKERSSIVPIHMGQPLQATSIGLHQINFPEVGGIYVESLLILRAQ
jgi:hypothetical protein